MSERKEPPSREEYEAAFALYTSRIAQLGGRVFAVDQGENGLYTWAVEIPGLPQPKARHDLRTCYVQTFRDVEVAFAKATLGVHG